MRTLSLLLLAGCSQLPPAFVAPDPIALPERRHGHRIERIDGGYLCIGGFAPSSDDRRGATDVLFLADGESKWQRRAHLHSGHSFFGSAVIDGDAFAIGPTVERYDAANDRWHVVTEAGQLPNSHFGSAYANGRIHVLGGFPEVATGYSIVDPQTGAVEHPEPPPGFEHTDHFHFLVCLQGELHVIGGIDGETFDMKNEHWVRRDGEWHALANAPTHLWSKFAAHCVHDEAFYLFGEFGGLRYDARDDSWRDCRESPALAAMPVAVPTHDAIYIVGGMLVEQRANIFWRYDVATNDWR